MKNKIQNDNPEELEKERIHLNEILESHNSSLGFCPKINAPCRNDCTCYVPSMYAYATGGGLRTPDKTTIYLQPEYCDYVDHFCAVNVDVRL